MAEDIHTKYEWREFKAQCEEADLTCHICGQPIDYQLPSGRPGSFELDHYLPRTHYPELVHEPTNWRPSHRTCNRARGAKPIEAVAINLGTPSEPW